MGAATHTFYVMLALFAALWPLGAFLRVSLFSKPGGGTSTALTAISFSFLASAFLFIQLWNQPEIHVQFPWFTIGNSVFNTGILLNNLSVLMLLLVSGIALLVHIYSTAYMKGEAYLHRYWAYLSLFCFAMLGLVIADNLFIVYMFWELVGFSSYLLIGFWFTREAAVQANKKAFIINRIGDLGFLLAILILYSQFKTLDIIKLFGPNGIALNHTDSIWLTVAGLGLVFGAMAKSAQFPLHNWLPDAMEGPTSVSSLIHAATMVAAGIFLLARVHLFFDTTVLTVIVCVGAFTAFMAATIALVQNDIKKILAYSTISQLGFMMLATGIGASNSAIFHLATHAFFKCLLFLCAGAVIHELHHFKDKSKLIFDHQDIRNMGGLRRKMPITFITMLFASLALAGVPFTSGFLSKDSILIAAFEWSDSQTGLAKIIPYVALLTSWLTTFYIARLIYKTFFGDFKYSETEVQIHEASAAMRIPMILLTVGCTFLVFVFNPFNYQSSWLMKGFSLSEPSPSDSNLHLIIPVLVNAISLGVIYVCYVLYVKRKQNVVSPNNPFFRFAEKKWYIDELYNFSFVKPVLAVSKSIYTFDRVVVDGFVNLLAVIGIALSQISDWFDRAIIDGFVNLTGTISKGIGNSARSFQTGKIQNYLVTMLFIVLTFFIIKYFSQAI